MARCISRRAFLGRAVGGLAAAQIIPLFQNRAQARPADAIVPVEVNARAMGSFDLRDPSHVRDYTAGEWAAALDRAGFRVRNTQTRRLRMDYPTWVERMRTPEPHRAVIRSLQESASAETAKYYAIEADGSFTLDTLQIEASACRARTRSK